MKLAKDVKLNDIGADAHGFVGADLAQLCLEAGLMAVRHDPSLFPLPPFLEFAILPIQFRFVFF